MQLSGEFIVQRTPAEVSDFLSDPLRFASAFPDCRDVRVETVTQFVVSLAVTFASMDATLDLHLEQVEFVPAQRIRYLGRGVAAGSEIAFALAFELLQVEDSSRVLWQGSFDVQGIFASFGGPMIDELGERNLRQLAANLRASIESSLSRAHISL